MHEAVASPLRAWESFYVIVGSSAGALIGLQFVVMTIIAEASASSGRKETISAFGTPNVVHFCAALLFSAIVSVPWSSLVNAAGAAAPVEASAPGDPDRIPSAVPDSGREAALGPTAVNTPGRDPNPEE